VDGAPAEPSGYVATRDCPNGACVVAKIEQFERVLADRQASERERLEALKYLVHFIGDMHQPLHASNNHDRGGNDVTVTFVGRQTNLHAVWDSGIIEPAVSGNERSYAMQLTRTSHKPNSASGWRAIPSHGQMKLMMWQLRQFRRITACRGTARQLRSASTAHRK